ncbi:MAG: cyclic nucleotide-binding domain-containing protein [Chloroflexi bacterium]|nr:cyclic nucleotide-binding domain-containing protein [Chloroflexota bacterium]
MMNIAEQLANSPLFKGVEVAEREALIRVMQRRTYRQGEILFHKGDPGDSMYLILSGRVRIFMHDEQGNELTIRHLSEMFGEFSVLDQQPRSASAAAADNLEVLVLHRDNFLAFLREHPLVGISMMRNLSERVRYTTTYLQKVIDATQQLLQGNYEQAMREIPDSASDAEIQELIQSFVDMARQVQDRAQTLEQQLAERRSAARE